MINLADNFKSYGIPVVYHLYKGTTHEFFGMSEVVPKAKDAEAWQLWNLEKPGKKWRMKEGELRKIINNE